MKALIVAAALAASGMAQAQTIGWLPNEAGSYIAFTDQACKKGSHDKYVYAREPSGRTRVGCYRPDLNSGLLLVNWGDGDYYTYPIASLRLPKTSQ